MGKCVGSLMPTAKTQTRLNKCPVWSGPLLFEVCYPDFLTILHSECNRVKEYMYTYMFFPILSKGTTSLTSSLLLRRMKPF